MVSEMSIRQLTRDTWFTDNVRAVAWPICMMLVSAVAKATGSR